VDRREPVAVRGAEEYLFRDDVPEGWRAGPGGGSVAAAVTAHGDVP
jgi:hypothetical protein